MSGGPKRSQTALMFLVLIVSSSKHLLPFVVISNYNLTYNSGWMGCTGGGGAECGGRLDGVAHAGCVCFSIISLLGRSAEDIVRLKLT